MAKKLATRVTRARGIASRGATGVANPRQRAATRRPAGSTKSGRAAARTKGAARLGAGSG